MSRNSKSEMVYHIVWSTKNRLPFIDQNNFKIIEDSVFQIAIENHCYLYACDGWNEHVHVVIRVLPEIQPSSLIGQLKGKSAFLVNKILEPIPKFKWQNGYYIRTVGYGELKSVIRYVKNQRNHHGNGDTGESGMG
ncbi:IS200/IS605 family transposase [Phaeocystidibacter luteus]|uniref:IS200/IS605 family transposase n=1 Tax=Phaeocystidibacter luteus TaxID=911197 RepID=A0A6N6RIP0_9FLAO|nr:IS200/IS605 family transposase [Phaeocystidibacter luteus]KAB2814162.1 IS200/IS605 family transposase [Phaeocystidibacter luteus]